MIVQLEYFTVSVIHSYFSAHTIFFIFFFQVCSQTLVFTPDLCVFFCMLYVLC